MFKRFFRTLLTLVFVGALIWIFAPRIFDSAANSLISSVNSQVQGMAQFVPAGADSPNDKKGDLQVNLTGLTPDTTYQLTLDQVQCGGNSTQLSSPTTDANGNLYAEIPVTSIDVQKVWYLNVLQQGQSVACGLLQTNKDAGTQVISASLNGPDVFGTQDTPVVQPTQDAQGQTITPVVGATPTEDGNTNNKPILTGLPNTGTAPGDNQQYDNNQFPRKY